MNIQDVIAFLQAEPLSAVLLVLTLALLLFSMSLSFRVSSLTRGGDGKSLEGTIKALTSRTSSLEAYARNNQKAVDYIETRLARSVQSIATERFDPFQNAGGMQSFATAFLNEKGDGVIVSGIHSRDQVRVYAKQVTQFASEHELSEEEARAVAKSKKNLTA